MLLLYILSLIANPLIVFYFLSKNIFYKITTNTFYKYFISFVIYYGLIGWLYYFIFLYEIHRNIDIELINLFFLGVSIFIFFQNKYYDLFSFKIIFKKFSFKLILIIFIAIIIIFCDFLESLSPLTNADTLAYHLTIPFQFINTNAISIPERALTGYQPLLTHMTYIFMIDIGGEQLLRFYFFICEILLFIFSFIFFREKISFYFSLILSVLIITLPIYIYLGGNGNVEFANILQVLSLFIILYKSNITNKYEQFLPAILIGLYASSKLFGILLFGSYFIFLLIIKKDFKGLYLFLIIFLVITFQWYLYIFLKTGSPIFPVFFEIIGSNNLNFWDEKQNIFFKNYLNYESQNIFSKFLYFFIYPIFIFIFPLEKFGGVQLSYGIFFIFSLPILINFLFKNRKKFFYYFYNNSYILISLFFYFLWYFFGSTLYFRYLVPIIFPLIFLHLRWFVLTLNNLNYKFLLNFTFITVISFQSFIFLFHNFNYIKFIFSNETTNEFYDRNVPYYSAIKWVNENITTDKIILTDIRLFRYFSSNKILAIQPMLQNKINISTNTSDTYLFYEQLLINDIKYILKKGSNIDYDNNKFGSSYNFHLTKLYEHDCLKIIKNLQTNDFGSRSINTFRNVKNNFDIQLFELDNKNCKF